MFQQPISVLDVSFSPVHPLTQETSTTTTRGGRHMPSVKTALQQVGSLMAVDLFGDTSLPLITDPCWNLPDSCAPFMVCTQLLTG